MPTFYGQDRWKTFVYEQKGIEIVKKRDLGVGNLVFVKIIICFYFFHKIWPERVGIWVSGDDVE